MGMNKSDVHTQFTAQQRVDPLCVDPLTVTLAFGSTRMDVFEKANERVVMLCGLAPVAHGHRRRNAHLKMHTRWRRVNRRQSPLHNGLPLNNCFPGKTESVIGHRTWRVPLSWCQPMWERDCDRPYVDAQDLKLKM